MKYLIMPIKLEEFKVNKCSGIFAGNQPFLRQPNGTFELKPNEEVYIGTKLDGSRLFIPVSIVSEWGVLVEPNTNGEVKINLTLPKEN